ncbi:MAG: hypothetical protein JXQ29_18485 [Planctomycetes bacterium]|nr:hypothetical protein [Planctomycetota bacterium]
MGNLIRWFVGVLGMLSTAATLAAQPIVIDHRCVEITESGQLLNFIPQAYLDQARQRKVLFCHRSVGDAILAALTNGLPRRDSTRYPINRGRLAAATWFDSNTGILDTGDGGSTGKFSDALRNQGYGAPGRANVAFMKYCYIDFQNNMDVTARWNDYRDTMLALERDFGQITFVWWTCAIPGFDFDRGNDERARFNHLVRQYCAANGKILFDLADIESHDYSHGLNRDEHGNEAFYPPYSADAQHPSGIGGERLATAMWWLLARIAGWNPAATHLELTADTSVLAADGAATAELTVRLKAPAILDRNNAPLYPAGPRVAVVFQATSGSFPCGNTVMTIDGQATLLYRAGATPGKVLISASAPGLNAGQAEIALISNAPPNAPLQLLCNGQTAPTLSSGCATLSWSFSDTNEVQGDRQEACQVVVLSASGELGYDSGRVATDATQLSLAPAALRADAYCWRVRTWDESGAVGPFSAWAGFTVSAGLGYALELEADDVTVSSALVNFGNAAALGLTGGAFTVEMWIFRTERRRKAILLDRMNGDEGPGWLLGVDADDKPYVKSQSSSHRRFSNGSVRILPGAWHHLACVYDGSKVRVYVDGVNCGENSYSGTATPSDLVLRSTGAILDEMRISAVARYTASFTPPAAPFATDPSTLGLWHFDEGAGTLARDASGNGHDGAIALADGWAAGRM